MKKTVGLIALALVIPITALAQSQLTTSFKLQQQTSQEHRFQLIRCDNSGSLTGTDGPENGEACVAGDWSIPIDCTGMTNLSIRYWEYSAAGNSTVKVWDCTTSEGIADDISQAPGAPTGPADPAPLCTDLTAGAGVVIDGDTVTLFDLSGYDFHYVVGEIDACTDCDSTLILSCGR